MDISATVPLLIGGQRQDEVVVQHLLPEGVVRQWGYCKFLIDN